MSGPPPVPLNLRILRGNPSKRPLRIGPQPAIADRVPEPPAFLSPHAVEEWRRVAPELFVLNLLTALDINPLAAYCEAFARWRKVSEKFAEMAACDPDTRGLLVKGSEGQPRINPLVRAVADAGADMVRFAAEFGMTPAARARIATGPFAAPSGGSKFDGLLA